MSEQGGFKPEFHLTMAQPCPYLPGRKERKLFTHLGPGRPAAFTDRLLRSGFRRSQNVAYLPYCHDCQACISVRLPARRLHVSKSLRRIRNRNRDLEVRRAEPVATNRQYALFARYIKTRHGDGGMAGMDRFDYGVMVEECLPETFISEYYLGDGENSPKRLVAAALCDRLSDGISMVYSFFDPDLGKRSLGSFMILEHVDYALELGLEHVYLGYWIKGCRKMSYKSRFRPQQHYSPETGWHDAEPE